MIPGYPYLNFSYNNSSIFIIGPATISNSRYIIIINHSVINIEDNINDHWTGDLIGGELHQVYKKVIASNYKSVAVMSHD